MNDKARAQRQQLVKAQAFLQRTLVESKGEIQRAAAIQAFEFCFELSWKYLKSLLEQDGSVAASPRATFREAAHHGFINNPEQWFEFLEARNLTVHTYVETVAQQVYKVIEEQFAPGLQKLLQQTEQA